MVAELRVQRLWDKWEASNMLMKRLLVDCINL